MSSAAVQKAFEHIRQRILSGELAPGAVLSEATLAKELGLSRTPVGEALRELAGVGLVQQIPRFGTIVRNITPDEMVELFEVREGLEPHAVALAAQRITPADVQRLTQLCRRLESFQTQLEAGGGAMLEGQPLREFLAADMAFHTLLIHATGNRRMARLIRDSHVMIQLFGARRLPHDRPIVAEVCRHHAQILAAVQAGDAEAARHAAAQHIRASLNHTLERLPQQRGGGDLASLALPDDVCAELRRLDALPASEALPAGRDPSPPAPLPQRERGVKRKRSARKVRR